MPGYDFIRITPQEIILLIFDYLEVRDLGRLTFVSREWKNMANDYLLWKQIFTNYFPIKASKNKRIKYEWKGFLKREIDKTVIQNIKNSKYKLHSIDAHQRAITCLKVRRDIWSSLKYNLASGSWDNTIKLWDIQTGKYSELTGHKSGVLNIEWKNDTLVSASDDSTIKIWQNDSENEYQLIATMNGHRGSVWSVDFNDSILTSCSVDGTFRLWNMRDYTLTNIIENIIGIKKVRISSNSNNVYYGHLTGMNILDIESNTVIPFDTKESTKIIETSDDYVIAGHPSAHRVSLYDHRTLQVSMHFPQRALIDVDCNPQNPYFIYSSSKNLTVSVWDTRIRGLYANQAMTVEGVQQRAFDYLYYRPSHFKNNYLESVQATSTKIFSTNGSKIIWNDYAF